MKSGKLIWVLGFLAPMAIAAVPHHAEACDGYVRSVGEDKTLRVAKAEQSLSEGKNTVALAQVVQAFPAIKLVKAGQTPLSDRALRIMALAMTRLDGAVSMAGFKAVSANDKTKNLEWSIDALRSLNARRINNPTYQTDLGEALSKVPKHKAEAMKILGELAAKDLLTSAEGYAALAKLRSESGDAPGRDAAVKRCEGMAKTPKMCQVDSSAARS